MADSIHDPPDSECHTLRRHSDHKTENNFSHTRFGNNLNPQVITTRSLNDQQFPNYGGFHLLTDKSPPQDWGFLSFLTPLPRPKVSCLQMLATRTHWSSPKVRAHTITEAFVHRKTGGLVFLYPTAKTYMPLDHAGDPVVKPKGMRSYHHGRIRHDKLFGFLEFFLKGSRPHPQGWGSLTRT